MSTMRAHWTVFLGALLAGMVCAQDVKPDPPREERKPHPDRKYMVDEELIAAFLQSFEQQGSPRVVVAGPGPIDNTDIDTNGLTQEISRIFSCGGDIDLVDLKSLAVAARREIAIFETKRHPEASELVNLKAQADLLVRVTCKLSTAREDKPWRVTVTVISLGNGREISYVPQDMPPVWSISLINYYTNYFVSKTFRNLMSRWTRRGLSTDVTVTLINVNSFTNLKKAKDIIGRIKGVARVNLDTSTKVNRTSSSLLRVRYRGPTDDLYLEVLAAMEAQFPVNVRGTDLRPNAIILTAGAEPAEEAATERKKLFGKLPPAYRNAGRPSIMVMVNSRAEFATDQGGRAGILIEHPPPPDTRGQGTIDEARKDREAVINGSYVNSLLEDAMFQKLLALQVTCKDGRTPRSQMIGGQGQTKTTTEAAAIQFVRDRKLADVLVSGVGTIQPGTKGLVKYTFRAVNVSDDRILGTSSVTWAYEDFRLKYVGKVEGGLPAAMADAANDVLYELMATMIPAWSPPTEISVKIKDAPSESSARALGKFIEQNAKRVTDVYGYQFTKYGKGATSATSAEFTLVVDGGVDELVEEIEALRSRSEGRLPYDVRVKRRGTDELILEWPEKS